MGELNDLLPKTYDLELMLWLNAYLNQHRWVSIPENSTNGCNLLVKHCLFVNSGSSALFIGVEAFSFPAGGEVIFFRPSRFRHPSVFGKK